MERMKHEFSWIIICFFLSKTCMEISGYQLTTSSDNATVGLDFTFICVITKRVITFNRDRDTVCTITKDTTDGTCVFVDGYTTDYTYTCNPTNNTYTVTIPGFYLTESLNGTTWKCESSFGGGGSNTKILYVNVPISSVTLLSTPTDKNPVEVVSNRDQTFSCTTNAARPSSRIQWYLSNTNITTSASPQPDVCNTDCSDDKVISSSVLTYTGNINDDDKILYCTAVNIEGAGVVRSSNKTIVIWYGPNQVIITSSNQSYTLKETENLNLIQCTADCIPNCTMTWSGPNLPAGTKSPLNLQNINRNQAGNYQCTARNDVSSKTSVVVNVVVQYQPTISSISNDKEVNENDTATIKCTVESIPQSIIRWIFEAKELQNKYDGSLKLNQIDCLSMGWYTCQAVNMLGMDNRDVHVTVKCSPRIYRIGFTIPSLIAIKDKDILNITAHIIAFPKPEMYWQFGQNGSYVNVSGGITNSFNINRHSSILVKSNLTEDDFGNYSVYAYNGVGSTHYLLHSVAVVPARRPNQPINVTCAGRINYVTVNWKSGFNGGKNQTFTVYYKRNDNDGNSEWTAFVTTYSDPGHNMYTSAEIKPLEAGASFGFQVYALNEYNYTVSETSYCNTSEAGINENKDQSVIIGAGAGVGSAIAILLIIGVIVFMIKRRRDGSPGQEKKLTKRRSSNKEDIPTYNEADDIVGVHANPMYASAELRPNERASKKMETEKTDTGRKEKDFEMGSVYENAEDIANSRADALRVSEKATMDSKQHHKYKPKRKKDGLVYADLELSPGPSGKRFAIRGLENRNNYAIIDLTKTAEPLPSDSESENEMEKTEANDKKGNNKQE